MCIRLAQLHQGMRSPEWKRKATHVRSEVSGKTAIARVSVDETGYLALGGPCSTNCVLVAQRCGGLDVARNVPRSSSHNGTILYCTGIWSPMYKYLPYGSLIGR